MRISQEQARRIQAVLQVVLDRMGGALRRLLELLRPVAAQFAALQARLAVPVRPVWAVRMDGRR